MISKTKKTHEIKLNGKQIEQVDHFEYLGARRRRKHNTTKILVVFPDYKGEQGDNTILPVAYKINIQ